MSYCYAKQTLLFNLMYASEKVLSYITHKLKYFFQILMINLTDTLLQFCNYVIAMKKNPHNKPGAALINQ